MEAGMFAIDKGGVEHIGKMDEKPGGIIRCQLHRFVCSCGWEGDFKMAMNAAADDFREHMDLIDYAIENG